MLRALPGRLIKKASMSGARPPLRCSSGGRLRGFIRNRVLLLNWQARDLPPAPGQAAAHGALDGLLGTALRHSVDGAQAQADALAGRIGGCARDAYTVLYGCAALAVLIAAIGAALGGHGLAAQVSVAAELLTLVVLFLTFHRAHSVNWHERWLGLRFHAEFLRCIPVLAMLREDLAAGWVLRRPPQDSAGDPDPDYLRVLHKSHHGQAHAHAAGDDERHEQQVRDDLFAQLQQRYQDAPESYAHSCRQYAQLLAQQQLRYHCLRSQQEQAIVHRVHLLSMIGFSLTIFAVLLHAWWHSPLLSVVTTGVPACAAALHGFMAQEESERLAASSQAMARRLHEWLAEAARGSVGPEDQAGLHRLVDLMMSDVRDWHRLFGEKGMYHLG